MTDRDPTADGTVCVARLVVGSLVGAVAIGGFVTTTDAPADADDVVDSRNAVGVGTDRVTARFSISSVDVAATTDLADVSLSVGGARGEGSIRTDAIDHDVEAKSRAGL